MMERNRVLLLEKKSVLSLFGYQRVALRSTRGKRGVVLNGSASSKLVTLALDAKTPNVQYDTIARGSLWGATESAPWSYRPVEMVNDTTQL
jgi:hypothetical protein